MDEKDSHPYVSAQPPVGHSEVNTTRQRRPTSPARAPAARATAGDAADHALSRWRELALALSPVIGERGVTALFRRSLHLNRATYACLGAALPGTPHDDVQSSLRACYLHATAAETHSANSALLGTYVDLLNTLIGPSLTERLVGAVTAHPPPNSPDQQDIFS